MKTTPTKTDETEDDVINCVAFKVVGYILLILLVTLGDLVYRVTGDIGFLAGAVSIFVVAVGYAVYSTLKCSGDPKADGSED